MVINGNISNSTRNSSNENNSRGGFTPEFNIDIQKQMFVNVIKKSILKIFEKSTEHQRWSPFSARFYAASLQLY